MFEQAFKNIDDVLWKDAGCTSELDYTEQTSWLLFLKYLDALERDKATEAQLDGTIDHNTVLSGDLLAFVDQKLFPYVHAFKQKASGPNIIEYKIGKIVGDLRPGSAKFPSTRKWSVR